MSYEIIETLKARALDLKKAEEKLNKAQEGYRIAEESFSEAQKEVKALQEALSSVSDLTSKTNVDIEVSEPKKASKEKAKEAKKPSDETKEIVEEETTEEVDSVSDTAETKADEAPVPEASEKVEVELPVFEGISPKTAERLAPAMRLLLKLDSEDDLPISYDDFAEKLGESYTKRQASGLLNKLESLGWLHREDDLFALAVEDEEEPSPAPTFAEVDVADDPFYGDDELNLDDIF